VDASLAIKVLANFGLQGLENFGSDPTNIWGFAYSEIENFDGTLYQSNVSFLFRKPAHTLLLGAKLRS